MDEPKPSAPADGPTLAPADGATMPPTGGPPGGPPPMPGGPPPMPGGPPPMPGDAGGAAPLLATMAASPSIGPGSRVFGAGPPPMPTTRYELGAEIARGGMGRVVEATDTVLGRVVALKEVLAMDADVLRRFARETRITARLEHPSIVPLHDAGTTAAGAPFYVMRKISGRPLERLVALAETLNQRLVLIPHVVAAAQAVAHAHERGIVHRDIKPSNILVGELGETIVIDWGLAKVIGEADDVKLDAAGSLTAVPAMVSGIRATDPDDDAIKTRAGIVFGTPGFMAPEQLRGAPVNERCDVYALGATLYHVLARKPPHHAKTADEMMRAAVRQPPTPIGTLVPGVPAELSTIIDKALAHDPAARYQDARSLAEDLQRFLSGQLVASHRYSPRERLVRFVKKNRALVGVSAAALAALGVVAAIAVTSVLDERDRADEQARIAVAEKAVAVEERARAERRADELTLTQARVEVDLNPTRAIAMIKPLAAKHWREVRSIAAAARAHGVAYGLPGPRRTVTLELSRDGTRALSGGDDGDVRIYDLGKRTLHALRSDLGGPVSARFADDERRVVLWRDARLSIVELATGDARPITAPSKIRDLEVVGTTAYWVDEGHLLYRLDLAGDAPVEVPMPEPIDQVTPSPDGRYLALWGHEHLLFHDRTRPTAEPIELMFGATRDFDWATDGQSFAALVDQHAILGALAPEPAVAQRMHVGARQLVLSANGRAYTIGPTGVGIVSREQADSGPRKQLVGGPVGLREARGGVIIAGSQGGIAVLSELGDHLLAIPAGALDIVEAHPRAPYVVATVEHQLLVWNLDELEPRRILDELPGVTQLVGADRVLAGFADAGVYWLDAVAGAPPVELGAWPLRSATAAPSGKLAVAIDLGHRARLLVPGREPLLLDGEIDAAGLPTDDHLVLGTGATGTVALHDVRTGTRTTLITRKGKLLDLAWSRGATPAWVAASFSDGTLWRQNLATGAAATADAHVTPATHLQVARDGTVLLAEGRVIRAWRPGGALDPHADLPRPVRKIGMAGPEHLLAVLDDLSTYVVALGTPHSIQESESVSRAKVISPHDAITVSMAFDTGTMVVANRGGVEVIDPLVRHRWTLALPPAPQNLYDKSTVAYTDPQIASDGTRVIARLPNALVTWSLAVPASADETARWVESLTNAAIDAKTTGKLIWR